MQMTTCFYCKDSWEFISTRCWCSVSLSLTVSPETVLFLTNAWISTVSWTSSTVTVSHFFDVTCECQKNLTWNCWKSFVRFWKRMFCKQTDVADRLFLKFNFMLPFVGWPVVPMLTFMSEVGFPFLHSITRWEMFTRQLQSVITHCSTTSNFPKRLLSVRRQPTVSRESVHLKPSETVSPWLMDGSCARGLLPRVKSTTFAAITLVTMLPMVSTFNLAPITCVVSPTMELQDQVHVVTSMLTTIVPFLTWLDNCLHLLLP